MKHYLQISIFLTLLSSCVSHQSLINFSDENGFPVQSVAIQNATNLQIQPEDLLRITVHSFDPLAAAPFNIDTENQQMMNQQMLGQGNNSTNSLELFMGYFVDRDGYVDFPVVGPVKLAGLSLEQAKARLYELVRPYLKDAVINMRFLNLKVSVIGEVTRPGTIRLTNKRITLVEAISMAGDLTPYANRNQVYLIREKDGTRSQVLLDLQSPELFQSPYFYLEQNDIIYIPPLKVKVATVADPAQRFISYTSGVLSVVGLILALTR